jgi:hypothetical protein
MRKYKLRRNAMLGKVLPYGVSKEPQMQHVLPPKVFGVLGHEHRERPFPLAVFFPLLLPSAVRHHLQGVRFVSGALSQVRDFIANI